MSNKQNKKALQFQKAWVNQKAKFTKNQLLINNFQVMQKWEDGYMKGLAQIVTAKGGNILEVGFGLGLSSGYIQKLKKIRSHTIIECHPDVINYASQKLKEQLADGRVILINGFWENVVSKLKDESFNGILFDTSPLDKETNFFHFFPFFKEAYRLLKRGGIFTYFSDEAEKLSEPHFKKLKAAGFKKIKYKVHQVSPLKNCHYWKQKTIVIPVVVK